jgi:hypothetical protein
MNLVVLDHDSHFTRLALDTSARLSSFSDSTANEAAEGGRLNQNEVMERWSLGLPITPPTHLPITPFPNSADSESG